MTYTEYFPNNWEEAIGFGMGENIVSENDQCARSYSPADGEYISGNIDNINIAGDQQIKGIELAYWGACGDDGNAPYNGPSHGALIQISKDNGSTWCVGHSIGIVGSTCIAGGFGGWKTCTHSQAPTTPAECNSNQVLLRVYLTSNDSNSKDCYVDTMKIRIEHADPITIPQAPTWAGTPFPTITVNSLRPDWVAPASGDAPTGYDLQWDTDSSFPTPPTQTIDVGGVTIYTHGSRSAGTKYYYRVRGYNDAGDGAWSSTQSKWTLCSTPSAPTVDANAVDTINVQHADITGLDKWQVMRSSAYNGSYSTVYTSGAGATALNWNNTGLIDGNTWYYKLYARNIDGNNSTLGTYASDIVWSQANAPAWASTKFPTRTINSILFDWITPTDLGDNNLIDYNYDWKIDGGSYAEVSTGSTNTSATKSGLAAGTKYWFKVNAQTEWGEGVSSTAEYHWTLCATPSAPTVTANAEGSLRIQHADIVGLDRWVVMRSPSGSGYTEIYVSGAGATALDWSDIGLDDGENYYYKLYARNADGYNSALGGSTSAYTWNDPTAPSAPTFTGQTTTTIGFAWGAAGDGGGDPASPISDYHYRADTNTTPTTHYDSSNNLTRTNTFGDGSEGDSALQPGTRYYFRVHGKNGMASDNGAYSSTSNHMTLPTQVGVPTVAVLSSGVIRITWGNVTGGNQYRVRRSATSNFSTTIYTPTTTDGGSPYDEGGLNDGDTWYYRVTAKNADGNYGAESGSSSAITVQETPSTPSDPPLTANAVGQIQATKPTTPSGTGITHWYIEWDNNVGFPSPTGNSGDIAVGTSTYNAGSLGNGNNYYFRVKFKNTTGYSAWSVGTVNRTTWDVPSDPIDPTLNADGVGDITATKPFTPSGNGSTITHWQVQFDNDNGFGSIDYGSGDIAEGTSTRQATGLSNGVVYFAQVRFKNAVGYGNWSLGSVSEETWNVPSTPSDPTLNADGVGDITVTKPSSPANNGSTITHWRLQVDESPWTGSDYDSGDIVIGTSTHQATGLLNNTNYAARVSFKNAVGYGAWSVGSVNETTWSVPSTPGNAYTFNSSTTSLTQRWSASSTGGTAIIRYEVDYAKHDGSYPGTWTNAGLDLEHIFSGLTQNTEYKFKVRAVNLVGNSAASEAYNYTNPITPTGLTVVSDLDGRLTVSWNPVTIDGSGGPSTTYDVRWDSNNSPGGETDFAIGITAVTTNQTGLSVALDRWYDVEAHNSQQVGSISSKVMGTTWNYTTAPGNCTFSARATGQITFNWTAGGNGGGTPSSPLFEYHYQWKVDGGGYVEVDTNSSNLSAIKSGLSSGTKYWFKVHGDNGMVADSGVFNTEQFHWTLCATPSNPTFQTLAAGQIKINWSTVTGVNQWIVEESLNGTSGWSPITASPISGGTLTTTITSLGDGATRYYRILARNTDGNDSGYTANSQGATTWSAPDAPTAGFSEVPYAVGIMRVTKPTTPSGNGSDPTHWYIEWDNDSGFPSPTGNSGDIAIGTTTYDISGLGNGATVYYHVRFKNESIAQYGSYGSQQSEITWSIAGNATISNISSGLRISRPTAIGSGTVTHWRVLGRPSTEGGSYSDLTGDLVYPSVTLWDDSGVTPGGTHYYKIQFKYSSGGAGYGAESALGISATAYSVPNQVVGLVITGQTTVSISFDWTDTTDDGSGITDYRIAFDTDNPPTDDNLKGDTVSNSTKTGVAGTHYYIRVKAINGMGEGSWSSIINRWTLCIAPTISSIEVTGLLLFTLTWSTITGVSVWQLERSPDGSTGWTVVEADIPSGTLSNQDLTPSSGDWFYRMTADNADGNPSAYSSAVSGDTLETNFAVRTFEVLEITPNKITVRVFIESNSSQGDNYGQVRNTDGKSIAFDLTLENGKYSITAIPHIKVKETYSVGLASSVYNGGSMDIAMAGLSSTKTAQQDGELLETFDEISLITMFNKVDSLVAGIGSTIGSGVLYANDDSLNAFLSKINIAEISDDPHSDRYIYSIFGKKYKDAEGEDLRLFYEAEDVMLSPIGNTGYSNHSYIQFMPATTDNFDLPLLKKGSYILILVYAGVNGIDRADFTYKIGRSGGIEEDYGFNVQGSAYTIPSDPTDSFQYMALPFYVDDETLPYTVTLAYNYSSWFLNVDYFVLMPLSVDDEGIYDLYTQSYTINNNKNIGVL